MKITYSSKVNDCLLFLGPIRSARSRQRYKYWLHGRLQGHRDLVNECLRLKDIGIGMVFE